MCARQMKAGASIQPLLGVCSVDQEGFSRRWLRRRWSTVMYGSTALIRVAGPTGGRRPCRGEGVEVAAGAFAAHSTDHAMAGLQGLLGQGTPEAAADTGDEEEAEDRHCRGSPLRDLHVSACPERGPAPGFGHSCLFP